MTMYKILYRSYNNVYVELRDEDKEAMSTWGWDKAVIGLGKVEMRVGWRHIENKRQSI